MLSSLRQKEASGSQDRYSDGPPRRLGPAYCVYARHSDLIAKTTDAEGQYWDTLQATPIEGTLRTIALINGHLSELRGSDAEVHRFLNARFLPADLREKLATHGPGGPAITIVFNVIGCLQPARHLILYGSHAAGSENQGERKLGEMTLLANEFMHPPAPFKSPQPGTLELLLSILPVWDVYNPRDLAYSLSRMFNILSEILPGPDPIVRRLASRLAMGGPGIKIGRLPLNDFVSTVFGLYVYGRRMVNAEPGCAVFEPRRVFSQVGFPEEVILSLVADRALTVSEFRDELARGKPCVRESFTEEPRRRAFLTESLNSFRKFPLLKLEDGHVLILHLQFLIELLTSGVYWNVFDGLPRNRREIFRELWGRLFELYVTGLLEEFYPAESGILTVDAQHGTGQVDALLDFIDDVSVFETKASLLTEQAKRGGDEASFIDDFNLKFVRNERGEPKGIMQLAASCKAVQDGKIRTAKTPARIYPVLVSDEPAVEAAFFNTFANEVFQREASPGPWIQPITVMSIGELEELLPYFVENHLSWGEVPEFRLRGAEVVPFSVHQAIYDLLGLKGMKPRRNQLLLKRFNQVWTTIINRYKPRAT